MKSAVTENCLEQTAIAHLPSKPDRDIDIDLFLLTDDPVNVRDRISIVPLERELRPVIIDSLELTMMENIDREFLAEIRKVVVMLEAGDEDHNR